MKIYKLTIGIDELKDEVEFIKEEQFNVEKDPVGIEPRVALSIEGQVSKDVERFLRMLIKEEFHIIGHA